MHLDALAGSHGHLLRSITSSTHTPSSVPLSSLSKTNAIHTCGMPTTSARSKVVARQPPVSPLLFQPQKPLQSSIEAIHQNVSWSSSVFCHRWKVSSASVAALRS